MIVHLAAPAAFGGLESVVAALVRGAIDRGRSVGLVLTVPEGEPLPSWATVLETSGAVVVPVRLPARAYWAERSTVRSILKRLNVSVVHTHGYRSDVVHCGVVRREGIPMVSTVHGFASNTLWDRLYEWLQRRCWRRFDAVVAVSVTLANSVARSGVRADRIHVIRNGMSPTRVATLPRAEARRRLGIVTEGSVVGWVGRMSAEKDPLLAIESLRHLEGVTFCFVGDGPELARCKESAEALGLSGRIRFAGQVPDAGSTFLAFDALLLSSRTEGTPMVIMEAATAGVPVISTAVGGVPDLLAGGAGWLVPANDGGAMAAGIRAALGDPAEARRRVARLQMSLAASGGEADWITQYFNLYDRLTSANPS